MITKKGVYQFTVFLLMSGTVIALGILLFFRYQMAWEQHFDIDEYAYLHWASQMARGNRPFADFYFIMPPGFLWVLAPLFHFLPPFTFAPVYGARVTEYVIFVCLAAGLGMLFWQLRRSWMALLVPLTLAFLPLPSIKFVEIRPDTLAMACTVWAMVCLVSYLRKYHPLIGAAAGILYALSLLISPKMTPGVLVGIAVCFGVALFKRRWSLFIAPAAGGAAVVCLGVVWALASGGFRMVSTIWYYVVVASIETSKLGRDWPIAPNFFFRPNAYFYGTGSEIPRITNHIFWGMGMLIAVWRIVSAIILGGKTKWQELLIGLTFVAYSVFFFLTPIRHAQYFIPLAVWIAWYSGDAIDALWIVVRRNVVTMSIFATLFIAGLIFLVHTARFVKKTRFVLPVKKTVAAVTHMWKEIPKDAYVFDLEGITLYYRDPYYACCTPFGQVAQYLSRPLPNLTDTLTATRIQYIYQGESGRINTLLLKDQAYIVEHFEPWEGHEELLVRKK